MIKLINILNEIRIDTYVYLKDIDQLEIGKIYDVYNYWDIRYIEAEEAEIIRNDWYVNFKFTEFRMGFYEFRNEDSWNFSVPVKRMEGLIKNKEIRFNSK